MKSYAWITSFLVVLMSLSAVAQMRPHTIEIDGQIFAGHDSWDLILGRLDKDKGYQPGLIADFNLVKLDGHELIPYVLTPGKGIFLHVEDRTSNGDATTLESKLKSPNKTAVICAGRTGVGVPAGTNVVHNVALDPGQAVFLMTYDDQYKINGNSINLYSCPLPDAKGAGSSSTEALPGSR